MAKELKEKTKSLIDMMICIVLFMFLQFLTVKGVSYNFNGVLMAFKYGLCLIMISHENKKGIIISSVLMIISLISIIRVMIFQKNMEPLPGLVNIIFYLATIIMLGKQIINREKAAVTDFLTGMLNRRGLYRILKRKIEDDNPFSVVYIDIDNFKFINDSYGHSCGERILKIIAERMCGIVGKEGVVTIIGEDEFVIVLDSSLEPKKTVDTLLNSIREKIEINLDGSDINCYLTCYAGIASYPYDSEDYEALIKYADIAMYHAVKEKSVSASFFNKDMADYMNRQIELETLIKEGLENDYFYLVYQPQYKLNGKKLRGFESLLRMKTPDGKFVSPGEFIPVAEKGDLILQIDNYVLYRAMKEFKPIVEKSYEELTVSVNVSAKNIGNPDFVDKVKAIIDETGFPAKNLEIEITEYCLVQSVDVTIENIKKLRDMEIQVALDDFGTGYTSLNYLAKLPINLLKVDKSLIDDIESNDKSRDFVHAVISMGHLMGCHVISEGVENEVQLTLLGGQECDFIQGYVWSRPLEYANAKELSLNSVNIA